MRYAPFALSLLLAGCSSGNDAESSAPDSGQAHDGSLARDGGAIDPVWEGLGSSESSRDGGAADGARADAGPGSDPPSDASDAGAVDVDLDALFNVFPQDPIGAYYNGGSILTGTLNVYMLWYGDWSKSPAPAILEDMLRGLSGDAHDDASAYDTILRAYYQRDADGGLSYATGRFQFAGSFFLGYSAGSYLGLGNEENVVANAISFGIAPYDPNGVYVISTSADVEQDVGPASGFCQNYCAFHRPGQTSTADHLPFNYVFAGDPMRCPDLCTMRPEFAEIGLAQSPNGDWSADGLASLVVHELFETVTDPTPYTGWLDPFNRAEIGDMCVWRFDPTFACNDGGSRANVTWGDRNYLIQQEWVLDDAGGHCALSP
jgi:hypothetical protein